MSDLSDLSTYFPVLCDAADGPATATELLAAAEAVGVHPMHVRSVGGGFLVPAEVAEAAGRIDAAEAKVTEAEDTPSEDTSSAAAPAKRGNRKAADTSETS